MTVKDRILETISNPFPDAGLTPTQTKVASMMSQGFEHEYIAEQMGVSVVTVRTHAARVREKTGVSSREWTRRLFDRIVRLCM